MDYKELTRKHPEEIPGLILGRNEQKHRVVYLHYTSNPRKAQDAWIEAQAAKYIGGKNSLQWRREFEIDFSAGTGELVFPELPELENDLIVDDFKVPDSWSFYGGLDWGARNPVSFHVYAQDPKTQIIYSVFEYYCKGDETNVFKVSKLIKKCEYYPLIEWISYDPSMNTENQQRKDGLTSIIRMFNEEVPEEDQIDKLMAAHSRSDMLAVGIFRQLFQQKKFKFFRGCQNQIDEFRNLKYPERKESINEAEKLLDKNNHAWDDAKYFILSHPTASVVEEKHKYGTVGYLNKVSEMARQIAGDTGGNYQQIFSDLYGKEF